MAPLPMLLSDRAGSATNGQKVWTVVNVHVGGVVAVALDDPLLVRVASALVTDERSSVRDVTYIPIAT